MLKVNKSIDYKSEKMAQVIDIQKKRFVTRYKHYDKEYDFKFVECIEGYTPYSLVLCNAKSKDDHRMPWYTNTVLLIILDIFMLGWIQRWALRYCTQ